jgi:ABC-type nickel/cobalt efflux system permease component RcnA
LCTLDKEQDKKVLGCTVSHLVAIQQTVEAYRAPKKNDKNRPFMSRYALIMEDDVFIPFNINWPMLVQSAPKDFGILQLFNSQIYLLNNTWNAYLNAPYVENNTLWLPREVGSDFWSTCAYLIDRQALKPIIESVVTKETGGGRLTMSIIAGSKDGSRPVEYTWDGVPPPSDKHHHHHSHHHKSSSSSDKSKHKHKEKEKKEKKAKDKHKEKRGRDSDSDGDNEPRRQLRAIYPTGPCFPKSCCGGSLNVTKEVS